MSAQSQKLGTDLLAPRLMFALFVLFALFGGASRGDEFVLVLLRPVILVMAAVALWTWEIDRFKVGWPIISPIVAIAFLCILQLVPLPPSIWADLPGREAIVGIDQLLFDNLPWRPITMSPSATYNALFYSLTMVGAFLVFSAAAKDREATILRAILAIATISVVIALISAQIGMRLYRPYDIMSVGPSGLFSNANHFGVFCSVGMLVALRLVSIDRLVGGQATQWIAFSGLAVLMLVGAVLSTSRLAFATAGIAVACSSLVFLRHVVFASASERGSRVLKTKKQQWIIGGSIVIAAVLTIALFIYVAFIQREASLGNFEEVELTESLRVRLAPILLTMAADQWLAGIGFGSFADYYAIIEPTEFVGPQYVNQAHNDLAQFFIEGGILSAFIALAGLAWLAWRVFGLFRAGYGNCGIILIGLLVIVALGSTVDYVLRVPLFAYVTGALLIVWLNAVNGKQHKGAI
ncbi:O-antigen ligase family protein [Aurantiacibacter aquimixticola]|nr:O-antigen ligase family protein [Aurantiacibacter aquimixticola]